MHLAEWKNQDLYGAELSGRAQHNVKMGERQDSAGKGQWAERKLFLRFTSKCARSFYHQTYNNIIAIFIFRESKKLNCL